MSAIGTGFITCGTGPPTITANDVLRGDNSTYFFASSIARSKLDFPSFMIDIEADPSIMSTTSFVAPRPKRLRFSWRSNTIVAIDSTKRSMPSAIIMSRCFG